MKFIKLIAFFSLLAIAYISCSSPEDPVVCTQQFVTIPLEVLEPSGEPADSVDITVVSKEDGDTLEICADESISPCHGVNGTYIIMHDGFHGEISEDREDVVVTGTKGALYFKEDFAFRSGVCHVEKVAGPDTVSLHRDSTNG